MPDSLGPVPETPVEIIPDMNGVSIHRESSPLTQDRSPRILFIFMTVVCPKIDGDNLYITGSCETAERFLVNGLLVFSYIAVWCTTN